MDWRVREVMKCHVKWNGPAGEHQTNSVMSTGPWPCQRLQIPAHIPGHLNTAVSPDFQHGPHTSSPARLSEERPVVVDGAWAERRGVKACVV